ncbi:hypothetical protein ACH47B_06595 [Rhodococcus sp. NPDC019627]|uniref:terminase small subunit n=1 Tax=unclassified Rhodococcus (in: high G+C Gram-positive bacteria) TaxID=192944 RepID=UPI0037AB3CB6
MTTSERDESLPASVARAVAEARKAKTVTDADQAAVDLAMRYALQIEAGLARGGPDATKALYLGPHLLKALAELGCTPAGRVALAGGPAAKPGGPGKLAGLRANRGA